MYVPAWPDNPEISSDNDRSGIVAELGQVKQSYMQAVQLMSCSFYLCLPNHKLHVALTADACQWLTPYWSARPK
jgi:hypothetical protein